MLQRTLTEQAAECFYSDARLATWLWDNLQPSSEILATNFWHKLQEHVYHLLVEGIETRYPREHRLTDIRQLMGHMCSSQLLLTPNLPWLHELQQKLLIRNGDLLCYREREVQTYVRLAAGMDPTLLAGWHLALWLEDTPQPAEYDIQRVVSAQNSFFAPRGNPSQPFAEGHVHFWGVTADSAILDDYLLGNQELRFNGKKNIWLSEQYNHLQPLLYRARQLLIMLLDPQNSLPPVKGTDILSIKSPLSLPDWGLLLELQNKNSNKASWLLGEFARAMQELSVNRWLWLYLYLCSLYRSQSTHPLRRVAILCFWQTVNLLRRSLIMDGQGLTRFAERYFATALGRGKQSNHDNIRRLWACTGDVAEIKSGPDAFSAEFTRSFAKAMTQNASLTQPRPPYIFGENEILPTENVKAYLQNLERWQFCAHFSRSVVHKQNKRIIPNSKSLWHNAEKMMRNLQTESGWCAPEFLAGKLNPNFNFQPTRWLRGLDVAGDENDLKIEWFAPILRWLRSSFRSTLNREPVNTGFHFSIHAGEDYAHPASGMRHVDETVKFCEMREGDRLGHALALGIEPKQWVSRQGEMILPLDEHLDNLVWLRHYAIALSGYLPLAQQILPLLNRRIARFWRESYWWQIPDLLNTNNIDTEAINFNHSPLRHATADDLFNAWQLRRNCYYHWQERRIDWPLQSQDIIALPDHKKINDSTSLAAQIYLARHKWLRSEKEEKLVIIRTAETAANFAYDWTGHHKNNLLEDIETNAELDFMHALQDWLLSEYDQLGLIIETNPTSNVYIGRLTAYSEHPIFRWDPPDESALIPGEAANLYGLRRGPIRVLINTDDPGIMPTTLRTEFLLLREAALDRNISRTVADRWLETLRQYGVEQFYRHHLPVFEFS